MSASEKPVGDDRDGGGNAAPEDLRRRFREALERKQGKAEEHDEGRPSTVAQSHTGPAKVQRTFRRKSG